MAPMTFALQAGAAASDGRRHDDRACLAALGRLWAVLAADGAAGPVVPVRKQAFVGGLV